MAKTKEELYELKEEVETLNKKLAVLTEEELAQVSGGYDKRQRQGYYCPNVRCEDHYYYVTPPEDCKCRKCGAPLIYGHAPILPIKS